MHHKKATTWVWHTIIQIIQIILGRTYNNKNFCRQEWSLMFLAVHIFYVSTLGKDEPFSGHRTEHWWMIPFSSFHLFGTFETVRSSRLIFIFLSFHLRCTLFGGRWYLSVVPTYFVLCQSLGADPHPENRRWITVVSQCFLYSKTTVWCTRIKS